MKKSKWFKKIPWIKLILGITVVAILLFVLISLDENPPKPPEIIDDKLQSVVVKSVLQNDLTINLTYFGNITDSTVYIGADRVQGRIKDVAVSVGDHVQQGSVLFTLDVLADLSSTKVQLSEIASAKGTFDLEINQLTAQVKKLRDLYNGGAIALAELEQAENQLEKLKFQRNKLSGQGQLLNNTIELSENQASILSPIDGTIEEIKMVSGTYIGQQDVIKIRKNQRPICLIMVDESNINDFFEGKKVKVIIGDQTYDGNIKSIKSKNEQQFLFPVEIEINSTEQLLAGRSAKVLIETYKKQNALMIPRSAVMSFANETYIFVLNSDNTVAKKHIVLGNTQGELVEITKGLSVDDKVLVEGQFSVFEGENVIVIEK